MDISVIICTYNRCESLKDTLEALLAQQIPAGRSLEILVMDNKSIDQTKAVVESFRKRSPWPLHYYFEPRQGKAFALNHGIEKAKGDWLFFTDDDVNPATDWILQLWNTAQKEKADCIGGKIKPKWEGEPPLWLVTDIDRQLGILALLDRGDEMQIAGQPDGNFVLGANVAYRKALFQEVGFFRTDVGRTGNKLLSGEDSEMVRRVIAAGKKTVYEPKAIVHHKVPKERMQLSYLRKWRFGSGRSVVRISTFQKPMTGSLMKECAGSASAALVGYLTGKKLKAIGAEENFWKKFGMLYELMTPAKKETVSVP